PPGIERSAELRQHHPAVRVGKRQVAENDRHMAAPKRGRGHSPPSAANTGVASAGAGHWALTSELQAILRPPGIRRNHYEPSARRAQTAFRPPAFTSDPERLPHPLAPAALRPRSRAAPTEPPRAPEMRDYRKRSVHNEIEYVS